jgi:hypothetical protein
MDRWMVFNSTVMATYEDFSVWLYMLQQAKNYQANQLLKLL